VNNLYLWLKFLHVAAVTVWLGAAVAVVFTLGRVAAAVDRTAAAALAGLADSIGIRLIAPASALTLVTGLLTMWVGHVGMPPWVAWGVLVNLSVFVAGGTVIRIGIGRLAALLRDPQASEADIARARVRMRRIIALAIALLFSVALGMVLKPA